MTSHRSGIAGGETKNANSYLEAISLFNEGENIPCTHFLSETRSGKAFPSVGNDTQYT